VAGSFGAEVGFLYASEQGHQPRGSASSCALCFLLAQVCSKWLFIFPLQLATAKSFPAAKKRDRVMAMPVLHSSPPACFREDKGS